MKILFLTLVKIDNIENHGIYHDLLRNFIHEGHEVNIVCPTERKYGKPTSVLIKNRLTILNVWTTNIQKINILEKGITTFIIEYFFLFAIKKHLNYKYFDLIVYSTPPITFTNLILKLKKISGAKTYLLLKDIFPQNAVDLNLIKHNSFIHKYFRSKEKELYKISDFIGCMSPENVNYLLKNNPEINSKKVEINPNSNEVNYIKNRNLQSTELFTKYNLPNGKVIFFFGGNLGLPQGIEYLKENIKFCKSLIDVHFLIVGGGTEYQNIKNWIEKENIKNASLINEVSKIEFDDLIRIADVGLIFLNPLFTIPNFPSRILSYMQNKIPILCATDAISDIGKIATDNNFGFKCLTYDFETFYSFVIILLNKKLRIKMGENAFEYFQKHFDVKITYDKIVQKF